MGTVCYRAIGITESARLENTFKITKVNNPIPT